MCWVWVRFRGDDFGSVFRSTLNGIFILGSTAIVGILHKGHCHLYDRADILQDYGRSNL